MSAQARNKDILLMLLTALLWSLGGVFVKLLPWHPLAIAGVRSVVAAAVIGVYMAARRSRFRMNRKTLLIALCLVGTYVPFVTATKLTTAANAIVIQYCAPLLVLLYHCFVHKQKLRLLDALVVLSTTLGVAVCFFDDLGGGSLPGDCIALVSGMGFAGMLICSVGVTDDERVSGLMQGQAMTALIGLPFYFAGRYAFTMQAVASLLVLGVFQIGISYILYSIAARSCPPLACALLSALEPLLNPVWVALFAGETPGMLTLVGGVLVIVSVTLWCVLDGKRAHAQTVAAGAGGA